MEATVLVNVDRPTVFNQKTCVKKGIVEVCKTRARSSHNIFYELHGAKENVKERIVFIMGLNSSSNSYEYQVPFFAGLPGWQVLVFDNRGVGYSDSPASPRLYKTTQMALDVVDLFDGIGWTQSRSIHVVGVSLGGMIAQHVALAVPDRLASLSLISTRMSPERPSYKATKMMISLATPAFLGGPKTAEEAVTMVLNTLFPSAYLDATNSDGVANRDIQMRDFLRRFQIGRKQTMGGRLGQTAAATTHWLSKEDCTQLANSIPKIFIMTGDDDNLVDPSNSKLMHEAMPGSEYLVINGGGHALVSQIALEFNTTIKRVCDEGRQRCAQAKL